MSEHQVTTFYSYKGGVGRSMALANIATLLASRGESVLVVDFDLDAPGLHRYFAANEPSAKTPKMPSEGCAGVIDFFVELKNRLLALFPTDGSYDPSNPEILAVCRALVEELVDAYRGITISLGPNVPKTIQFLPAALFDKHYQDRIRSFDWVEFFDTFKEVFPFLRDAWKERYDHVLVDSRTGLTDIGSVTTMVLPDRLVIVFAPNEQSLHGGVEVARQAIQARLNVGMQPQAVFPLLCRVDPDNPPERKSWLTKIAQRWSALFRDLYNWPDYDWLRYFEDIHIVHSALLAYGEKIVATELLEHRGIGTTTRGFEAFVRALDNDSLASWFVETPTALPSRRDRALVIAFDANIKLPGRFTFETILQVPTDFTEEQRQTLRTAKNADAWQQAARDVETAVKTVLHQLRGELFVFVMAPYAIAVLVGRLLDEFARTVPTHIHQFDVTRRDWFEVSGPAVDMSQGKTDDATWYDDVLTTDNNARGKAAIISIDGTGQIAESSLVSLAGQINADQIVRLRQKVPSAISSAAQARLATRALRKTLEAVQSKHPTSALHIVTRAPVALMIELGRMLSSSVYGRVFVHQYEREEGRYVPVLDVMHPFEPPQVKPSKPTAARKTSKKKS